MSATVVPLAHGWQIGEQTAKEVELRELTAGDIIDAGAAAERVVALPGGGHALVQSPTLAGVEMLARQIVRIGEIKDLVVTPRTLRSLHPDDLEALQVAADALGRTSLEGTEARGRGDRGGAQP